VTLRVSRFLILLLALSALPAAAQNYPLARPQVASAEGKPAPDFTLPDAVGKPFQLSKLRGQRVVVIFYRAYW
jgi:cytochrome oxidase Cu insertion factor (SCO1/SenC/PrrC family)